ncbi:hypothetical protein VTK56DRAFT_9947 [Thermocarpiscus australiensis]
MLASAGRGWLAAAALLLGAAKGDLVRFTGGFEGSFNTSEAIIRLLEAQSREFGWTVFASDVAINEIKLWTFDFDSRGTERQIANASIASAAVPITSQAPVLPPAGPTDTTATGPEEPGHQSTTLSSTWGAEGNIGRRQSLQDDAPVNGNDQLRVMSLTSQGGSVSLADVTTLDAGMPLYFEAIWQNGVAYSRLFTFVRSEAEYWNMAEDRRLLFANQSPYKAGGTSPTQTTSTPTPNAGNNPTGNPERSSGSRLSGGAVIGIAVACGVVGLALIFGLVWFLLRRRRQRNAAIPVGSYKSGKKNRAEDLMAEKEAGAEADASPHSPYSDDGAAHADGGGAAHRPPPHQQDQPRSFTPYSDRPSAAPAAAAAGTPSIRTASIAQTDEARVNVPSPTPGRATPRALTTPYAHLVEEGMTEEEIRRLEEEERQLDAAIEQAGRR